MANDPSQAPLMGSSGAEAGQGAGGQDHHCATSPPPKPSRDRAASAQAVAGQVRHGPSKPVRTRKAGHAWGRWCW